ncbi:MAG: prohibitin family protein [Chloroflexota bacterium]|nr:prohibitin family protein [Chloroflexota bacterium]
MDFLPAIFLVLLIVCVIGVVLVTMVPSQRAHQLELQSRRFGTDAKTTDIKVQYPFRRTLIAGVFAFFALWILSLGVIIVPAGFVGVVRFLGQVQPNVLYPGATWVIPFVNNVEEVDTRVQPHNFQQLTAATAENLQVTVTGTMNYHLDAAFAGQLIQNVGTDFASKIIDPAFSDYIKQVTPAYSADSNSPNFILNKRDEIRQLTKDQLNINLARYHIIVDDIYLVDIGYPDEYNAAITSKQVEQQNVQREEQILEQKRIQAQQVVVTAQGAADALRATAAGQADANASINGSLTDELIRWQAIQKLNPNVQIMLLPEGNSFILPLPSLQPVTPTPAP